MSYANFKDILQFIKFDLKLIFRKRKTRYFHTKLAQKKKDLSSFNHKSFKTRSQRTELNCDLLIKNQLPYLLTLILIRLAATLVTYCANKCQEESIRLTQIWHSVFYTDRSTPIRSLKKFPLLKERYVFKVNWWVSVK